ncbi:MAG: hypothetical protein WCR02_10870, partial [Sphaerochaetaceae bacterium]
MPSKGVNKNIGKFFHLIFNNRLFANSSSMLLAGGKSEFQPQEEQEELQLIVPQQSQKQSSYQWFFLPSISLFPFVPKTTGRKHPKNACSSSHLMQFPRLT